jgi:hypothetical protein
MDEIIDEVQKVRSSNNKLWMDLLRLSATYAQKETAKILKSINTNDKKISKLLGDIK